MGETKQQNKRNDMMEITTTQNGKSLSHVGVMVGIVRLNGDKKEKTILSSLPNEK